MTKHLAVALQSGMTLVEGLEILVSQAKGKMRSVMETVLATVQSGESFSGALGNFPKYFSALYVNMIRSGEAAGTLVDSLKRLTVNLQKQNELRKKIKSAMVYPMLVFVAVFGLGIRHNPISAPRLI